MRKHAAVLKTSSFVIKLVPGDKRVKISFVVVHVKLENAVQVHVLVLQQIENVTQVKSSVPIINVSDDLSFFKILYDLT